MQGGHGERKVPQRECRLGQGGVWAMQGNAYRVGLNDFGVGQRGA